VIVTHDRLESLRRTIGAVVSQTRPPDEVVVVDNASTDGTVSALAVEHPAIEVVALGENVGYGAGLAAGLRTCHRRVTHAWLLDDDSRPRPDALAACLRALATRPACGLLGLGGGDLRWGVPRHRPEERSAGAEVRRADFVLVDGAVVTAEALDRAGYPRQDLFMMFEDVEYSTRIRRAGLDVFVLDGQLIERDHAGSQGSAPPPWRGYYQSRNHLAVALDHRSPLEVVGWAARQARFAGAALVHGDRRRRRIGLRVLGGWDAVRGRMGRTVEPGANR
jgi:GT2 family glycosyltransferase